MPIPPLSPKTLTLVSRNSTSSTDSTGSKHVNQKTPQGLRNGAAQRASTTFAKSLWDRSVTSGNSPHEELASLKAQRSQLNQAPFVDKDLIKTVENRIKNLSKSISPGEWLAIFGKDFKLIAHMSPDCPVRIAFDNYKEEYKKPIITFLQLTSNKEKLTISHMRDLLTENFGKKDIDLLATDFEKKYESEGFNVERFKYEVMSAIAEFKVQDEILKTKQQDLESLKKESLKLTENLNSSRTSLDIHTGILGEVSQNPGNEVQAKIIREVVKDFANKIKSTKNELNSINEREQKLEADIGEAMSNLSKAFTFDVDNNEPKLASFTLKRESMDFMTAFARHVSENSNTELIISPEKRLEKTRDEIREKIQLFEFLTMELKKLKLTNLPDRKKISSLKNSIRDVKNTLMQPAKDWMKIFGKEDYMQLLSMPRESPIYKAFISFCKATYTPENIAFLQIAKDPVNWSPAGIDLIANVFIKDGGAYILNIGNDLKDKFLKNTNREEIMLDLTESTCEQLLEPIVKEVASMALFSVWTELGKYIDDPQLSNAILGAHKLAHDDFVVKILGSQPPPFQVGPARDQKLTAAFAFQTSLNQNDHLPLDIARKLALSLLDNELISKPVQKNLINALGGIQNENGIIGWSDPQTQPVNGWINVFEDARVAISAWLSTPKT